MTHGGGHVEFPLNTPLTDAERISFAHWAPLPPISDHVPEVEGCERAPRWFGKTCRELEGLFPRNWCGYCQGSYRGAESA
jgi:hypothetical protein